ncbi:hypothetical protein ONZ45_g12311 [Pleurotus djamor]|nr:hypothetical protein ONZ45_g12311 [Pleurotus djamor]
MDYFEQAPIAGPSNTKHVHVDEVDSATPPSSPSEQGEILSVTRARRHTPTAATYATLLGRDPSTRLRDDQSRQEVPHHRHRSSRKHADRIRSKPSEPFSSHSSEHYQQSQAHSYPQSFGTSSSSAASRAKVEKLNSLLLLTSTRLTEEASRARAAEEKLTSALSLLTKTRTEQAQVHTHVSSLSTQLDLYKNQLAVAQQEILRAQRVVEDVEKGRREAEESAARARARARRLEEERVVRMAIEQGRREGYKQGLERGRQLALARAGRRRYVEYEEEEDEEDEEDVDVEEEDYPDTKSERSVRTTRTDGGASQRVGSLNVARYAPPLPIPTLTTPPPLRVPSTQPQPILRPPSAGPSVQSSFKRVASNSRPIPAPSKSPESIQPLDPRSARATPVSSIGAPKPSSVSVNTNAVVEPAPPAAQSKPIQPIPIQTLTSPVSHRPIIIPPDGFIPVLDSNSMINLPPPHELSQTPRTIAMSLKEDNGDDGKSSGKKSRDETSSGRQRSGSRSTTGPRVVNGDVPEPTTPEERVYKIPRAATTMSSASLSQFDILSPPNTAEQDRVETDRRRADYARREPQTPTPSGRRPPTTMIYAGSATSAGGRSVGGEERRYARRTPSQEIEDQWRATNTTFSADGDKGKGRAYGPPSTETRVDPRTMSPRGPRRPNRIVMPEPLSLGSAAGMMHNKAAPPPQPTQSNIYQAPPIYHPPPPQPPDHTNMVPFPRQSPGEHRQRSPLQWIKRRFSNRTPSNGTVPQISVEPPSQSPSGHSQDDALDPILLTPDHAHQSAQLPSGHDHHTGSDRHADERHSQGNEPVPVILPDNQLPVGFVPMTMTPSSATTTLPAVNGPPPKYKIYDDVGPERPSTSASRKTSNGNVHDSPSSSFGSGKTKINGQCQAFSPAPLARPLSLFSNDS